MHKLYETQSYTKEINTLIESYMYEGGKHYVTFEDTIFFPEEGGQYADTGVIRVGDRIIRVLNGEYSKSDDGVTATIRYEVDGAIAAKESVFCVLDWDNRFSRMQNHSGEHIMSGLINTEYGLDNVGFHLSDCGPVTLTMNGVLTYDQVIEIEAKANEIIYKNVPIKDSYPTDEELGNISYRSKIEIDGQVRLITIGEKEIYDICACCAPHVASTGAIGIIKVVSVTNYKGGVQIGILCGRRALEYINHQQDTLTSIAQSLSTHPDNVPSLVISHIEEINRLKGEVTTLREKEYLTAIADDVTKDQKVIFADAELSALNMKNIYNALIERYEGFVGIFVGDDVGGYRYYAGSKELDSRILADNMRTTFDAKGGGNSDMIQGKISAKSEDIRDFFSSLDSQCLI